MIRNTRKKGSIFSALSWAFFFQVSFSHLPKFHFILRQLCRTNYRRRQSICRFSLKLVSKLFTKMIPLACYSSAYVLQSVKRAGLRNANFEPGSSHPLWEKLHVTRTLNGQGRFNASRPQKPVQFSIYLNEALGT